MLHMVAKTCPKIAKLPSAVSLPSLLAFETEHLWPVPSSRTSNLLLKHASIRYKGTVGGT